jgi:hypothetical protein
MSEKKDNKPMVRSSSLGRQWSNPQFLEKLGKVSKL